MHWITLFTLAGTGPLAQQGAPPVMPRELIEAGASAPVTEALPPWLPDWIGAGWGRFVGEDNFFRHDPRPYLASDLQTVASDLGAAPEDVARWIGESVPPAVPLEFEWTRTDSGTESVLLRGKQSFEIGRVAVLGEFDERVTIVDWDVEIAQATMIGDPVHATTETGAGVALRLIRLPGGRYEVEWIARAVDALPPEALDLSPAPFGPAWRNGLEFSSAAGVCTLEPGRTASLEFPGTEGATLRLALTLDPVAPPSVEMSAHRAPDVRMVDAAVLAQPAPGFRHAPLLPLRADTDYELPDMAIPESITPRELVDRQLAFSRASVEAEQDDALWRAVRFADERGLIFLQGERAPELQRRLEDALVWNAETRVCALVVTSTDIHGRDRREHVRLTVPARVGRPTAFAAGRAEETCLEWNVEVAQGARAIDPYISYVDDGVRGDLAWVRGGNGEPYAVDLSLVLSSLREPESEALTFDVNALRGQVMGGDRDEKRPEPSPSIAVEQPPVGAATEFADRMRVYIGGHFFLTREQDVHRAHVTRTTKSVGTSERVLEVELEVR